MVCDAVQDNQLRPAGGNSGAGPNCIATLAGLFLGDSTMKYITLTQGKRAIVDNEDFDNLNKQKWCITKGVVTDYAYCKKGGKAIYMHRVIMGATKGIEIDHRNHNGLDNRKSNLRPCTHGQHQRTRRPYKGTSSKYKGVSWSKPAKKWRVMIWFHNKPVYIGAYTDEKEAARVYNENAKELFGEFAWLNTV